ncbi:hypothetical protein phiK7A1_038c [Pseudomonas phage phiK7A1]|uniref:DUF7390 domain-containing protein n=1 Tax=Pseudomonas phage phiK7A1 TaxID=2759194 RepID=A0A7H0XFN8_9CAUD|nr:hypothetical protein phiK7A1_038c [Pseudomonas phage phiK7A1]
MQEEFVVLDTAGIQQRSLMLFMDALGYKLDTHPSYRFVSEDNAANRFVRLQTAQRLHNSTMEDWTEVTPGWFTFSKIQLEDILVNGYQLQMLYAVKLVKKTKWLHTRKKGHKLSLMSPMVKPAAPQMTGLLGLS